MTPFEGTRARRFLTTIAGDAFLFTTAMTGLVMTAFGLISLAVPGVTGPEGPTVGLGAVVAGLTNLFGLAAMVGGPVVAWKQHGRDFSSVALAGLALGIVASGVIGGAGVFALIGAAMGIGTLSGNEFVGLGVVFGVLVIALLAIVVALDVDAVRDMARERSEHRRLDTLRLVATGVLAAFIAGVIAMVIRQPGGEFGEAIVFAIGAGAGAGIAVGVADAWVRRAARGQTDTGARAGA